MKQRALSGAVGTDDGMDHPRRYRQVDIVYGRYTTEAFGEMMGFKQRHPGDSLAAALWIVVSPGKRKRHLLTPPSTIGAGVRVHPPNTRVMG